ncbi:hypothetical protein G7054_g7579 [Neopestalotiopsis clavispora]|nr:hypothetical protein G7054_g7579 [Neopestalotiopsis clavispora]
MFLRSLKIGLQSPTNLPFLSRTKQIGWVLLLLSSIPLHLFFNSAIYNTAYQSLDWNVTVATEHFVQNGIENQTYWLPGASLAVSGSSSPAQAINTTYYTSYGSDYFRLLSTNEPILGFGKSIKYGYWNQSGDNDLRQQIATTAQHCANWTQLNSQSCMDEFRPYKFQTEYKNVVIVVSSGQSQEEGWRRDQIFDINSENQTDYWNSKVPPDVVNSLWFWGPCAVSDKPQYHDVVDYVNGSDPTYDGYEYEHYKKELRAYDHSCGRIFGLNTSQPPYQAKVNDVVPISFSDPGTSGNNTAEELSEGYEAHLGARSLQIDHCLAEPVVCQVRASNTLFLIVIICVLFKIATCSFLLLTLKDISLVTPGDAIESFISDPDPVTKGLGSLALPVAQGLETNPRKIYSTVRFPELTLSLRPRRWVAETRRVYSAVYRGIWVQAYYPIFLILAALLIGTVFSGLVGGGDFKTFGKSEDPHTVQFGSAQLDYLSTLIVVNIPQVLLSFVYLTVNTLYTQLQVEQEWNAYAREYTPLRVSYPAGEQTTTYRLQLPYKYSIPLVVVSILLHWIVSNSIFLLVVEGIASYLDVQKRPDLAKDMGVAWDAMITVGTSPLSTVILFGLGIVFILSPLFFRTRKLKNDMVVGGTNSLVISSACHVPNMSRASSMWLSPFNSTEEIYTNGVDEEEQYLVEVARGKVRWGAMSLPPDLATKVKTDDDEPVMHLGFGTEEHNVQAPQTGTLYA